MAFRATNILPQEGFNRAKSLAAHLKNYASTLSASWASGADSEHILDALKTLIGYSDNLKAIRAISGIGAYAQSIGAENDPAYDIVTEFNVMILGIDAAVANIIATFPADGSGYLLATQFDGSGGITQRVFTGASLAQARADLDTISTSIS